MASVLYLLAQESDSQPKILFSIAGISSLIEHITILTPKKTDKLTDTTLLDTVKKGKKRKPFVQVEGFKKASFFDKILPDISAEVWA